MGSGAGREDGRSLLRLGLERFNRVGVVQRTVAAAEARRRADRLLHAIAGAVRCSFFNGLLQSCELGGPSSVWRFEAPS